MPVQCSPNAYDRSHVAVLAQLGEHCTGIAEVVGWNPAQSLKFFSGLCSSSVPAAFALITVFASFRVLSGLVSNFSQLNEVKDGTIHRSG